MQRSLQLSELHRLQGLREHRCRAAHSQSIRARKSVEEQVNEAQARLDAADAGLARLNGGQYLQLDHLQIMTGRIMRSEAEVVHFKLRRDEAAQTEESTRTTLIHAEQQSEFLAQKVRQAARKERRKAEDRSAVDFLSALAAQPRTAR